MIEKLEYYSSSMDGIYFQRHPTKDDIIDKLHELIDKINELEEKLNKRQIHKMKEFIPLTKKYPNPE